MKIKFYSIIILSLILISACAKEEIKTEVQETVNVKVVNAESSSFTPVANFSGSVQAAKEANLGAVIPGKIEKFLVKEGQMVKKGDLLVQLADELLTQAEIEKNTLQKDFQRIQRLFEKGSVAEIEFDHVKAKYEASVEKHAMIRKNTEIRATFDGMVVEHLLKEGENFMFAPSLTPGYSHASGVVRLMQVNPVKIEIDINEKDLSLYRKGLKAEIIVDAYPDRVFEGKIHSVKPILSHKTRTTKAEILIDNPDLIIKPGMFGRVKINLEEKEAVFIPRYAVLRQSGIGEVYVFVVNNNRVERRVIEIIDSVDDMVSVKGLRHGEKVVTAGKANVVNGTHVRVLAGGE